MAWSPLHLAPWARTVTLSSSTTYLPPPHTIAMPPPSRSPCGSLMPSKGRCLPTTRPWIWHATWMTGDWSPSSPITTSQTLVCSTLWLRYTRSTVRYRSSRQPVVRAVVASREPAPIIAFKAQPEMMRMSAIH